MKPVIAIPSYRRPKTKILAKFKNTPLKKFLFVRAEEMPLYEDNARENGFELCALTNVNDIGETRRDMVQGLHSFGYEWAFILDDDISHVEELEEKPEGGWNSKRLIHERGEKPRMETRAFKRWFQEAKRYGIALSSPNHRAYDRFNHGNHIRVNKSAICACYLAHLPALMAVGNYKSINETGNEDYYMQYLLMKEGYSTGKMGFVEFSCPSLGSGKGGCNADDSDLVKRYEKYVSTFLENVCDDPNKIKTKVAKSGVPSITFNWKGFDTAIIELED